VATTLNLHSTVVVFIGTGEAAAGIFSSVISTAGEAAASAFSIPVAPVTKDKAFALTLTVHNTSGTNTNAKIKCIDCIFINKYL